MSTKTQTTTTHYHIQKKRRAEFMDEWRKYRQTVIRNEDVTLVPTARGLRNLGIGKGDPVAIYMPMIPEAVIAAYAIASSARSTCRSSRGSRRTRSRRASRTHPRRR